MFSKWRDYELQIYRTFQSHFPHCTITHDITVTGIYSQVPRQIDVAIRGNIEGFDVFGVIECKCLGSNVDVPIVDSFVGFMEDIGADFGYIITTKSFSVGALNRAKTKNLHLQPIQYRELGLKNITIDELINEKIQALTCIEQVFMMRQQQTSAYIDLSRTSLTNKTVAFKIGFAETTYFIHKKLLQEAARVFRDFPNIGNIRIIIPSEVGEHYTALTIDDLEQFLKVRFEILRNDIGKWRDFLSSNCFHKTSINSFAQKYVLLKSYS